MTKRPKKFLTLPRITGAAVLLTIAVCFGLWLLVADKNVAVFNPQGVIATQQKDLLLFTLALSLVVVVPVFTMLAVIAWKYREGNTKATYQPEQEGNRWLEIMWWGIPVIIIGILCVVTWVSTHQLDPYKSIASDKPPLKVQVVALQWKWLFLYPDYDFASVNELRMPVGTTVDFEITADSPMSAFWIPNLGSQTYAMNGMSSKLSLRADNEGSYRGSNTNISGEGYSDMHFQAIAMKDQAAFDAWIDTTRSMQAETLLSQEVYDELAKKSNDNPVKHYRFYDDGLYTGIMQKYMSSHQGNDHGGAH